MSNLIIPVGGQGGQVKEFTKKGMVVMSEFHMIAQQNNWAIVCQSCGTPVQGSNSGNDRVLSIACQCTEYRCDAPGLVGRI